MTNSERYRAAFSGVRAPEGAVRRALEALDRPAPKGRKKARPLRLVLAAAIAAALLIGTVGAEVDSGAVSNLLAPLFGGAQAELVGDMGVPIGASVSVDGYTLTAEAMIGDRYNVAVVYSFTRDDGEPIPDGAGLDWHTSYSLLGSGGGSLSIHRDEETPHRFHLVETWTRSNPLLGRMVTASFSHLSIWGREGEEEDVVLAEGPWELTFALRYRDFTVRVPVEDLTVTDELGGTYEIKRVLLSPIGVHIDLTAPTSPWMDPAHRFMENFTASLRLTDGTEISLRGGGGGGWSKGDERADGHFNADLSIPIPLEEIEALILCGTEVPVEAS